MPNHEKPVASFRPRKAALAQVPPVADAFVAGASLPEPIPAPASSPAPVSAAPVSAPPPSSRAPLSTARALETLVASAASEARETEDASSTYETRGDDRAQDKRLVRLSSGEERRRINMLFPLELARRLRRYCADRDTNLTDATIAALDAWLRNAGY